MKTLKVVLTSIVGLLIITFVIAFVSGNKVTSDFLESYEVDEIINVNQFSRITGIQLLEILGEPEQIEDLEWKIPTTGESVVGKLYFYENKKFEFILFDDSVTRLNVYSEKYWEKDAPAFTYYKEDDLFKMFGIEPASNIEKTAHTNYALRFNPVSDTVEDFWVLGRDGTEFIEAKITYNMNYY